MNEKRLAAIRRQFAQTYGSDDGLRIARAPGRVNIIGEHTDYNDGFVLPMAIDRDVLVAFRPGTGRVVGVLSANFNDRADLSLDAPRATDDKLWTAYLAGVIGVLKDEGHPVAPMDCVIEGTVPLGGGLGSSGAYEVAFATAMCANSGICLAAAELAKACRRAEVEFVGLNCGIMDQFVSARASQGHALFLDCRSLETQDVPLSADVISVVVCDTGVRHRLASSEYNTRRQQCEEAVERLKVFLPKITSLRDVCVSEWEEVGRHVPSPVRERARHVITENERVERAVGEMRNGNYVALGVLMDASHASLRDDYEVTCPQLDTMVEIAHRQRGVYGSRMTGGGFGGCTVSLVEPAAVDGFIASMRQGYHSATNIEPKIYPCRASRGAEILPG